MATIEEDYVSFEIARLLKEKGFNEACNRVYEGPNLKYTTLPISPLMSLGELGGFHQKQLYVTNNELGDIVYTAPTQQMAMRWLRKVHNLIISVELDDVEYVNIATGKTTDCDMIHEYYSYCIKTYEVSCDPKVQILRQGNSKAYEEACEVAIKYCLENLI